MILRQVASQDLGSQGECHAAKVTTAVKACRHRQAVCALQVYSARTALTGCNTLADMWSHQDTDELQRLKDQLTLLQDSGVVFPEDSWPMRLLRSHPRYAARAALP